MNSPNLDSSFSRSDPVNELAKNLTPSPEMIKAKEYLNTGKWSAVIKIFNKLNEGDVLNLNVHDYIITALACENSNHKSYTNLALTYLEMAKEACDPEDAEKLNLVNTEIEKNKLRKEFKTASEESDRKALVNIFLDKIIIPGKIPVTDSGFSIEESPIKIMFGWNYTDSQRWFSLGLEDAVKDDTKGMLLPETKEILSKLNSSLIHSGSRDKSATEICTQLLKLKDGTNESDMLVIPSGTSNHRTLLSVSRQPNGLYTLTHYNSGAGLQNHYKGEMARYQLHQQYVDIPFDQISNLTIWESLFKTFKDTDNTDQLYNQIKDLTGSGTLLPRETTPEFFSAPQKRGTCSVQCMFALLRHTILSQAGDPQEKLAQYKILKSSMMKNLLMRADIQLKGLPINPKITSLAKLAVDRATRDFRYAEIASSSTKFEEVLKMHGEKLSADEFKSAREAPKLSDRMRVVRKLSKQLIVDWKKNCEDPANLKGTGDDDLLHRIAKDIYNSEYVGIKEIETNIKSSLESMGKMPVDKREELLDILSSYARELGNKGYKIIERDLLGSIAEAEYNFIFRVDSNL